MQNYWPDYDFAEFEYYPEQEYEDEYEGEEEPENYNEFEYYQWGYRDDSLDDEEDVYAAIFFLSFKTRKNTVLVPKHKGEVGRWLDQLVEKRLRMIEAAYLQEMVLLGYEIEDPLFEPEECADPELVELILTL